MNLPTLTQLAREQATFARYEDGALWYRVYWRGDDDISHPFEFPIPTDAPDLSSEVTDAVHDLAYNDGDNVVDVRTRIYAALTEQAMRGAGGGKFLPEDRAITFLRWIRPHLERLKAARVG